MNKNNFNYDPMFEVMNNKDIFREIFSFLRKDAIVKCDLCHLIIQWDNTRPKKCDYVACGERTLCFNCWFATSTRCTIS